MKICEAEQLDQSWVSQKKKEKKEKKEDQSWKWMGQLSNQMENFGNIKIILFKYENRF